MFKKQSHTSVSGRKWQVHVQALERSGMSRAEYCRQHDLSYHALTYWQRKLHHAEQPPVLVQIPTGQPMTRNPVRQQKNSGVSIQVNNRMRIELTEQFSPAALDKVLGVLEGR